MMLADTKAGETAKEEEDNMARHTGRGVRQYKDCDSLKHEHTKGRPRFIAPINYLEFPNAKAYQVITDSLSLSGCRRLKMPYIRRAIPWTLLHMQADGERRLRKWG
jgi:hypothetical protein